MKTPLTTTELVDTVIRDLGRPRFADVAPTLGTSLIAPLFRKDAIRLASGQVPCLGEKWSTITQTYTISDEDIEKCKDVAEIIDLIKSRQREGLIGLVKQFEEAFVAKAGKSADPQEWGTIILKGWWLRQTMNPGKPEVFIDSTYAFVPRVKLPLVEKEKVAS